MALPPPARILVIEDDPSVSILLERTLARDGHEVVLAVTGAAGREEFSRSRFDLVILDKNLPDVDGMRLLKDFRRAHPEAQAIVITGDPSAPTRLAAQSLGAFAYLSKPFELGALSALCAAALAVGSDSHA